MISGMFDYLFAACHRLLLRTTGIVVVLTGIQVTGMLSYLSRTRTYGSNNHTAVRHNSSSTAAALLCSYDLSEANQSGRELFALGINNGVF